MTQALTSLAWPVERLGDGIIALARSRGLPIRHAGLPPPPPDMLGATNVPLERWIEAAADAAGIEAELVETPARELSKLLAAAAPAIVRVHSRGSTFLLIARSSRRCVTLLAPDLELVKLPLAGVCEALCEFEAAPWLSVAERVASRLGTRARDRIRVRAAILNEAWRASVIRRCWHLRLAPGTRFAQQLAAIGGVRRLAVFAVAHLAGYALFLCSWWTVGRGALQDRLDSGWLWAWALLLLTWLSLRLLSTWAGARLALDLGRLLKQRMLAGALSLEPDQIRQRGIGQLVAPVLEAEELESAALQGGLFALTGSLDLVFATALLAGSAGTAAACVLAGFVMFTAASAWRYLRVRSHWTEQRLSMTHDLIERMLGHRTRLCQEAPELWHAGEDETLARYIERSSALDSAAVALTAAGPRGWLIAGLSALAPNFVSGASSVSQLAVALGAVVLSYRALQTVSASLVQLLSARCAWREVEPLYRAATQTESAQCTNVSRVEAPHAADSALLEGHNLGYRHSERTVPVLTHCSLRIRRGDCLLLEGPSGSGKSTLFSLLAGLRAPCNGTLLVAGLDRATLGRDSWRQHVAAAPQFQDNHVLMGSFAFNLLMSRSWPPRPGDLQEAELICDMLGLGELLARMPAGMHQTLGETGWRLSHGERSRLFIARTLLQGADIVLLDESFAALDPHTLQRVGRCVLARAPALLVIAHP